MKNTIIVFCYTTALLFVFFNGIYNVVNENYNLLYGNMLFLSFIVSVAYHLYKKTEKNKR